MKIIRSDKVKIEATGTDKQALMNTLSEYQLYVQALRGVIVAHWPSLGSLDGTAIVQSVEGLIHPTLGRPSVRYRYFHRRFYKFPSYLRRAAVMDASGQVRSFFTRYDQWLDGERRHPHARPPRLSCQMSNDTFPSLYKGQCIRFSEDGRTAFIKVFWQNDWIWRCYRLHGEYRYRHQGKSLSPLLVFRGKHWELSVPEKIDITLPEKKKTDKVLAVDVGINTAAACAVVDKHGTVLDRALYHRSDKDREYRIMQRIRNLARKQTRHGNKLPVGFCGSEHRRLRQLMRNEAQQISRKIVTYATQSGCPAIVLENLKGWRPKAGKKHSPMKMRFHRWFHRMLANRIDEKAKTAGMRVVYVYARGTSSYAYDGSGKVQRDKDNYSICTFSNGKRYHADLNAAYNIAARGIVYLHRTLRKGGESGSKQKSCDAPRNPVILSSLWGAPLLATG